MFSSHYSIELVADMLSVCHDVDMIALRGACYVLIYDLYCNVQDIVLNKWLITIFKTFNLPRIEIYGIMLSPLNGRTVL